MSNPLIDIVADIAVDRAIEKAEEHNRADDDLFIDYLADKELEKLLENGYGW